MGSNRMVAVLLSAVLVSATRTSLRKHRSDAFMGEGTMADAQSLAEQARLVKAETSRMDSIIVDVQGRLNTALLEFGNLVEVTPANMSTKANKTAHLKKLVADIANTTVLVANTTVPVKAANKTVAAVNKTVAAVNKTMVAAAVHAKVHVNSRVAHTKKIAQNEQDVLEKLFKHLKHNIVNLNKEEGQAKKATEKQVAKIQARLNKDKADMLKKDVSAEEHEMIVNRTRTDEAELKYWNTDRSLGHQMFHDRLKMTHGLMSRVQSVVGVCKEAIVKGHVDAALMKKVKEVAMPGLFVQMRVELAHNAQQHFTHVLAAREGLM